MLVADQLTKLWIRSTLDIGEVLWQAGIFSIVRSKNTGAAFGLFQGHALVIAIVASVVVVLVLFYVLWAHRRCPIFVGRLSWVALGLSLGGIIGNLIERACNLIDPSRFVGVTDFISVGWWPSFNIADSSLVVGTILLAYSLLLMIIKPDSSS
ncbi:MAG: signal peptidase II [Dehalococcoidales bacterium]|nr:signal peptidase II [Dehalococcoidales bacterium]